MDEFENRLKKLEKRQGMERRLDKLEQSSGLQDYKIHKPNAVNIQKEDAFMGGFMSDLVNDPKNFQQKIMMYVKIGGLIFVGFLVIIMIIMIMRIALK